MYYLYIPFYLNRDGGREGGRKEKEKENKRKVVGKCYHKINMERGGGCPESSHHENSGEDKLWYRTQTHTHTNTIILQTK